MDSIHDDVAEFASLLTCLKERTDRSYAALARRLDVHASTLHRYCSGEAVPQDFAGVERFAALCGASPEERTELHRRWIVAVAARQRPRPSDGRRASAASASANHSSPAAETPEPAPPADPRPRAGRLRRWPVRTPALAVSLAVALVGLAASVAGPFSVGGASSAPTRITPERSTPAAQSGHSSQKNRANAGTAPQVAPLTWTANSHTLGLSGCGEAYVVAKPPRQVPPPPHPEDIAAWVDSQRAVHGGSTGVQITVQGRGSAAVVLEALHVRVVNRVAPAVGRGILYSLSDGCGAGITPRFFSVNLDAHLPLVRSMPGDNAAGTPIPAIDFPYRVSLQEPEVLVVSSLNESCTCDWYLDLDWSSQGRTGTARIDDHGRPFRTTSTKGLLGYRYDRIYHHPGRWVPIPAANMAATGD
ncbi:helix-turn-helix domain-containing protein [Streptomyces sp. NBC_00285]|uniref:helix-turn-helix domain-containing protein n=1 Tax=Streptomyces sp. NBC_00285 TaxID=2975700 RepID=UPI002E2B7C73|nr:helix-turn-helix transcriptional regulator [Streptomyces sp. NBC_00285]